MFKTTIKRKGNFSKLSFLTTGCPGKQVTDLIKAKARKFAPIIDKNLDIRTLFVVKGVLVDKCYLDKSRFASNSEPGL